MAHVRRHPKSGRWQVRYRDPAGKPRRQRFSKDRTESELAYHRWVVENYDQSAAIIAPDGNIGKGDGNIRFFTGFRGMRLGF